MRDRERCHRPQGSPPSVGSFASSSSRCPCTHVRAIWAEQGVVAPVRLPRRPRGGLGAVAVQDSREVFPVPYVFHLAPPRALSLGSVVAAPVRASFVGTARHLVCSLAAPPTPAFVHGLNSAPRPRGPLPRVRPRSLRLPSARAPPPAGAPRRWFARCNSWRRRCCPA